MHLSINNPKTNTKVLIPITFDLYGNLYFEFKGLMYQVNIDGKNYPVLEPGDYSVIPDSDGMSHHSIKMDMQNESDEDLYNVIINEDLEKEYGVHNKQFSFSSSAVPVYNRKNGDVSALYNTLIYSDEKLHFKSESIDTSTYFSIKLYLNGDVRCSTAYVTDRVGKLVIQDDVLMIVST